MLPAMASGGATPTSAEDQLRDSIDRTNIALDTATTHEEHSTAILRLQLEIADIESRISGIDYAAHPSLREVLTAARDGLRSHLAAMNLPPQVPDEPITPLSELIAFMPDIDAQRLANALAGPAGSLNTALQSLYDPSDVSTPANRWRAFIATHSIKKLGGRNSLSFLLQTPGSKDEEVLKLDYPLGNPHHMGHVARTLLPDLITPIASSRLLLGPPRNAGSPQTGRYLVVTPFCQKTGAHGYAHSIRMSGDANQTMRCCHHIMTQMLTAFKALEANNIYFPDSKLSNWLVTSQDILKIADTKSFLRCQPDGIFNRLHPDNADCRAISSVGYCHSEIRAKMTASTWTHSAIFGRNIYFFLTGKEPVGTGELACTESIFTTPIGKYYSILISNLTKSPPTGRARLDNAECFLRFIGIKLDPNYTPLEAKITALESITGCNLLSHFRNSIQTACVVPGYNQPQAIVSLDTLATSALTHAQTAENHLTMIKTPPLPTLLGHQLLPDISFSALFSNQLTPVDYTFENIYGILTHIESQLQAAVVALPMLHSLQNLYDDFNAQRFGADDAMMDQFLEMMVQHVMVEPDFFVRIRKAENAHIKLVHFLTGIQSPLIASIRTGILDLYSQQSESASARAKRTENFMKSLPIDVRCNLEKNSVYLQEILGKLIICQEIRDKRLGPKVVDVPQAIRLIDLTTKTTYAEFESKIIQLENIFHFDLTACLNATLLEGIDSSVHDSMILIRDLNLIADEALAVDRQRRKQIHHIQKAAFEDRPLLPLQVTQIDRKALISNSPNLNALVNELKLHNGLLQHIESTLNQLLELTNTCRALSFGSSDIGMRHFLDTTLGKIRNGADLSACIREALDSCEVLKSTIASLQSPVIRILRGEIIRLRELKNSGFFSHSANAEEKANAIEEAAAEIPVILRGALEQHQTRLDVQKLFTVLKKHRSGNSHGSQLPTSYRNVMHAIEASSRHHPRAAPIQTTAPGQALEGIEATQGLERKDPTL